MIGEGVFIHVPAGVTVADPIHILNITSGGGDEPILTSPRNLVVLGDGAQATVVEDYVGMDDDAYFTNAVTEFVVGESAVAEHYLLERESPAAYNISTLRIHQRASSKFASHSVLLGGAIVRNNIVPVLDGEHCHSVLNGLYLTSGSQHMDNHMRVVHAKPHCDSRQFYKGVLDDDSTAVFSGRIIVAKDAQKTDAKQSNANLLLTDRCRANTHPQLEIYADDVKCTHGATIGQMNEDAIFYLRARGLTDTQARGMLIHAFAAESLERMTVQPIVDFVDRELFRRLPEGRMVAESMQEA
jgi:Fe-S cluster assembly protein SufD